MEFKSRNDAFNEQLKELEQQLEILHREEQHSKQSTDELEKIRTAVDKELSFQNGINSALVTTVLDHIVVKRQSTKQQVYLDIYLKLGALYEAGFQREKSSLCLLRLRNITPARTIRTI